MSAITRFLPRKILSRVVGVLVHWEGPKFWAKWSIRIFAGYYRIRLDEAEFTIDKYKSIGDFFVRNLKDGIRPIGSAWALHPADSIISQHGPIIKSKLIQAKGLFYTLESLTGKENANDIWDGGYFLTYYLCPTDYHRVHSPVSGVIQKATLLTGDLWPVNEWSTSNIVNLFGINERILVEIKTDMGVVGVVFVGATNVGQMELSFTKQIYGNRSGSKDSLQFNIGISKGDELGMFRMGSTVVVLYPKDIVNKELPNGLNTSGAIKVKSSLFKTKE